MNPTLKLLLTGVRYTTTSISTAKYEVSIRVDFNHKKRRRSGKPIMTFKYEFHSSFIASPQTNWLIVGEGG